MTARRPTDDRTPRDGGTPAAAVEPAGRQLDPRGVRVSVVGGDASGPPPIVLEPAPMAIVASPRTSGVGVLGGVALQPAAASRDGRDDPPTIDGEPLTATLQVLGPERAILFEGPGGPGHRVLIRPADPTAGAVRPGVARQEVVVDGWRVEVDVQSATRAALEDRARRGREEAGRSGPTEVHAIIPGVVVSVSVAPGDAITAGQQLLVVEAMKMQNELRAPRDGTIERVGVGAGSTIEVGDLLLVIA
jgi:biotin carboxyl carrier protein